MSSSYYTKLDELTLNLQTGGKLSCEVAYEQIEALWKQLELSKKELGISAELNQHSGGA